MCGYTYEGPGQWVGVVEQPKNEPQNKRFTFEKKEKENSIIDMVEREYTCTCISFELLSKQEIKKERLSNWIKKRKKKGGNPKLLPNRQRKIFSKRVHKNRKKLRKHDPY